MTTANGQKYVRNDVVVEEDPRTTPGSKIMKVAHAAEIDDDVENGYGTRDGSALPPQQRRRRDASQLPFSKDIVGIYSHHGRELPPSYYFVLDGSGGRIRGPLSSSLKRPANSEWGTGDDYGKVNQDRAVVAHPYGGKDKVALFAVYDGHGHDGDLVSEFAMGDIQNKLYHHPDFETDKVKAIHETFLEVENDLENNLKPKPTYSGTTACIILLTDKHLYISNLGDSRAVLGRRPKTTNHNYVPKNLTRDQKPDSPDELSRLQKSGAHVTPSSPLSGQPARVWRSGHRRRGGAYGLAMSRSLGDVALKRSGVIADPVVTEYDLEEEEDRFVILATDGVWEFVDSGEAVAFVGSVLDGGGSADEACKELVRESVSRWRSVDDSYRDDITVIVVKVKDIWKAGQ